MKITIAELRHIVAEVMKGPTDGEDLALLIRENPGTSYELVLYRPEGMKELFKRSLRNSRSADFVIASMDIFNVKGTSFFEVQAVAALPGWGPFMYDKAMALAGGLAPDRFIVSESAKKIWSYYYHKRPDVEKQPLKDARLHGDEVLDCVYSIDSDPDTRELEHRNAMFLVDPMWKNVATDVALMNAIVSAGDRFFVEHKRRLGK